MKIVVGQYPPMIEEIDAKFGVRNQKVLFAWGDTIFNPAGIQVTPMLVEHERVHAFRQRKTPGGVVEWWTRYIADQDFRLQEEVYAHTIEFKWKLEHEGMGNTRKTIKLALLQTALRLTSPIYKYVPAVTVRRGKELIEADFARINMRQFGFTAGSVTG